MIQWEIHSDGDPELQMSDGRPFVISKRYTASLHSKSKLSIDLKSWRGRDFTPEERNAFDLRNILGVACLLSISHEEKNGNTYANIAGISNKMRGYQAPQPNNQVFSFDLSDPDWGAFELLGNRLKEQIMLSPEYAEAKQPAAVAPPARQAPAQIAAVAPVADFDSDIPF